MSQIEKNIKAQLKPLIASINTMDRESRDYKIFRQNFSEVETKGDSMNIMLRYMTLDSEEVKKELSERSEPKTRPRDFFHQGFLYLGSIEILGNYLADFVIMLLIANGYDFHIECAYETPRIRHVTRLDDMERERVPLTTKLNFIESCQITFLSEAIKTRTRNNLAHMKFEIKENEVYMEGKPAIEKMRSDLDKVLTVVTAIRNALMAISKELST